MHDSLPHRQRGLCFLSQVLVFLASELLLLSCTTVLPIFRPQQTAPAETPQLAVYRNGTPDPRVSTSAIDAAAPKGTEPDLPAALQRFTALLTAGEADLFMKMKLIHDWIALSIEYDEEMAQQEFVRGQDLAMVLRTRKAVCAGYARLFSAMSAAAGIDSILVNGRVRSIAIASSGNLTPHAWNLVRIGGRPYLVDVTFDAATIVRGRHVQSYSTDYLFAPPEQMKYTHFPDEPAYQLLSRPLDMQTFLSQPLVTPAYFTLDIRILKPLSSMAPLAGTLTTSGMCELEIEAPADVYIDGGLYRSDGRELPQAAMAHRMSATRWRVQYAAPSRGLWHALLFAAKFPAEGNPLTMQGVLRFNLQASEGWPSSPAFPLTTALYGERPGEYLVSPLAGILQAGSRQTFVYVSRAAYAALLYGNNFLPMQRTAPDRFELAMAVPRTDQLKLAISDQGDLYRTVLVWTVR